MLQTVTHEVGEHASVFFRNFVILPARTRIRRGGYGKTRVDKSRGNRSQLYAANRERRIIAKARRTQSFGFCPRIETGTLLFGGAHLPLYEYRCTSCGYSFEKIQNFSAEPERECPKCHGVLIRPVTAPALRFEGAGWYVNDYAGKGGSKKAEGSGEPPAAGSDASTANESKIETKSGDSGAAPAPAAPAAAPAASAPASSSSSS